MGDELSAGLSAGADILGIAMTNSANEAQQAQAESFDAQQAQNQMNFQANEQQQSEAFDQAETIQAQNYNTQMSNTAYQRATADMKAAGINPMLAYMQGGASSPNSPSPTIGTPSGSAASAPTPPRLESSISSGINTAVSVLKALTSSDADRASATRDRAAAVASLGGNKRSDELQPVEVARAKAALAGQINSNAQSAVKAEQAKKYGNFDAWSDRVGKLINSAAGAADLVKPSGGGGLRINNVHYHNDEGAALNAAGPSGIPLN